MLELAFYSQNGTAGWETAGLIHLSNSTKYQKPVRNIWTHTNTVQHVCSGSSASEEHERLTSYHFDR